MRIVCISDTHMKHKALGTLPDGDVLIHAGDALAYGTEKEFWPFSVWMAHQPHALKIYVPGNHDFFVEENLSLATRTLADGRVHTLVDKALVWKGMRFYGSPWVPNLLGWAYYGNSAWLTRKFGDIPGDTDVLVTHGPPNEFLDWVDEGVHVGSPELQRRVAELAGQLKLHVFGHIHEGYGTYDHMVNAAVCNREYEPINAPIVVDIAELDR
jgi:calcineurin-like phosphoesterase family protein